MKMRVKQSVAIVCAMVTLVLASCSNNNDSSNRNTNDTNYSDSRRNAPDTSNYITKDSGNKSQDVVDPDLPH